MGAPTDTASFGLGLRPIRPRLASAALPCTELFPCNPGRVGLTTFPHPAGRIAFSNGVFCRA